MPLYQEFDENRLSSSTTMNCYMKDNCLEPESIQNPKLIQELKSSQGKSSLKPSIHVPLSKRTKTWDDLESQINKEYAIDVHNVRYR